MARAVALDPKLELLDAARDAHSGVFFVPRGDVFYYRGMALDGAGAGARGGRVLSPVSIASSPTARCKRRVEGHLRVLGEKDERPAPARRLEGGGRGDGEGRGPLPAPLIDAAWKSQPRLLDPASRAPLPWQGRPRGWASIW
jgi:hypothetical protein